MTEREWYRTNIHPHGTVPALVTSDGATMIEGAAIILYLADLYQQLLPSLSETSHYYRYELVQTIDDKLY